MKNIILTTESVADIPQNLVKQYGIEIIPMHVIMNGKAYLETEIDVEEIYHYYDTTKKIPTTTAKNVQEYHVFFEALQKKYEGCTIVHVGYTSRASGSFQSATIASRDFENIYLIDTLNVTAGLAAITIFAAQLLEKNKYEDVATFVRDVEEVIPKVKLSFAPDTLEFLRAGGRLSNAAFIGASLLKIKPCIEIIEGKLASTKKYRGHMHIVAEKLFDDFTKQFKLNIEQIYLVHSSGLAKTIMERMEKRAIEYGFKNITWIKAGPTISTHAGPGCFGIAGIEV